jgi:hypothetical protein
MAYKIESGKVYHAQNPNIGAGLFQVIGGSITLKGSNVTEYEEQTNKLKVPEFGDLVDTGDSLDEGFHSMATLPEWFGFEGSAEVWAKMCVDPRIEAK